MTDAELKIELTESGPCQRLMSITVEPPVIRSEREKVITEFRKSAKIKGFRPGKAPRELISRTFADSIHEELLQKVVTDSFRKALEENAIMPVNQPRVQDIALDQEDKLTYLARFDVSPKIELNRYQQFSVEKKIHLVQAADVDKALEDVREQQAQFVPKEGQAEMGDYLLLDFSVLDKAGRTSSEGRRTNQLVMAGHEDQRALFSHALIGRETGENQVIEIDFPEDYPDNSLKGQKVTYKVDIKGVKQKKLPELDDHFARQVSQTPDLAGLKDLIRKNLEHEISHRADHQVEHDLFQQIVDSNPFEVPPSLVESAVSHQIEDYKKSNPDVDGRRLAEILRPSAEFAVKREYILMEVARRELISVTDEDLKAKMTMYAAQLGKPLEEIQKDFRSKEAMSHLRALVSEDKVARFLIENNAIKIVEE